MSTFAPCLCVIFNHPYPQVLPVLDRVYQPRRFPLVRYLMPFDRDTGRSDVITTYRGSYHHQGFVTDAAPKLRDIECTHYVFIQDDVLLNPRINANTLQEVLDIGPDEGFIPQMGPIDLDIGNWHWMAGILWRLYYPRNHLSGTGVDSLETLLHYLPDVEEAKARMARYGIGLPLIRRTDETFGPESVMRRMPHFSTQRSDLIEPFNQLLIDSLYDTAIDRHTVEIPYPFALTAWCADFYVIPKKSFDDFAHYSGILAAAGIFAEISVGTAMALSIDRVKTERDNGTEFEWRWDPARNEFNLDEILAKLEKPKMVAMHPFKFSLLQQQENALEQVIGLIETASVPAVPRAINVISNREIYENQVSSQIEQFASVVDMHGSSDFADWLNSTFLSGRINNVFGAVEQTAEFYARHIADAVERSGLAGVVSLGSGYGALEIEIVKWMKLRGLVPIRLTCAELSPILVERTRRAIQAEGLTDVITAEVLDLNGPFDVAEPVAAFMANHSLHHFVELEHIFSQVSELLHPEGAFITQDMIGRNGHMRWPEVLTLVREIWSMLPERYKWSHQHGKLYRWYENFDCSIEGFEGIRSQDILPELLARFKFEKFFATGAITDVFTGPSYGPNFNLASPADQEFILRLQLLEDKLIDENLIKPTQIFAVMRSQRSATCPAIPSIFENRSPERSLRPVNAAPVSLPSAAALGFESPYGSETQVPPLATVHTQELISFASGGRGQHITRWGWGEPEEHFTWSWGTESALEFDLANEANSVHFRLFPYHNPNVVENNITLILNGKMIGNIDISAAGILECEVPFRSPLHSGMRAVFELICRRPRRPDFDGGLDKRPLGVALISMRLA